MENYYLGNGRRWIFAESSDIGEINGVWDENIPGILRKILAQRNIHNQEEAISFLEPTLEGLHDPFLLEGMPTAAERIVKAVENKEKILVYGDYDVDGVSATSILVLFFRSLKLDIDFYIPDRIDEGYGISDIAAEYIISRDYDLLITVDCGITSRLQTEEIYEGYARKNREIDIIITDHHQCKEDLIPDALAIINPHIPASSYPFKHLCGAGIALKLVHAVGARLGDPKAFTEYMDLAALATIADIVDLKGENRIITRYGIKKIIENPCAGIKALIKAASIREKQIDSARIAFALAPRVNAAGRMGDAGCAVTLLTTVDESEACAIAQNLNKSNIKRQETQDEIYRQAISIIEKDSRYEKEKVIVVCGKGWHHGVIGIVASKLADRYHKPAFVLSADDGKAVGSGRSIEGFNLFDAMKAVSALLDKFGGHEMAGGLSMKEKDTEAFRAQINAYADRLIDQEMLMPSSCVHLCLEGAEVCLETAKLISRLEPFGAGNQVPLFCFRGAAILDKKVVGSGKHLKLTLGIDGKSADGIYFNKAYLNNGLFIGDLADILFTLEVNAWQNKEYLQIRVLDMRLEESSLKRNRFLLEAAQRIGCLDCDENWLYNGIIDKIICFDDIVVNRDILSIIYRYINNLKPYKLIPADFFIHARILENKIKRNINILKIFVSLLVFDELGLMDFRPEAGGSYTIRPSANIKKADLDDSRIFRWISRAADSLR